MKLSENVRECVAMLKELEGKASNAPWHRSGNVLRNKDDIYLAEMATGAPYYDKPVHPDPDMKLVIILRNTLSAQIDVMEALALAMGNQSPMRISMGLRMKLIGWCATVREAVSKLVKESV